MAGLNCTPSARRCEAIGNRMACASATRACDVGIILAASGDSAQLAQVVGNGVPDAGTR